MGLARELPQDGDRGAGAGAVRRPAAGHVRDAARQQPADVRQRFDGAARARSVVLAAHDAGAAATSSSTCCTSTSRSRPGRRRRRMLLHPARWSATFHAAGDSASYKYLTADHQACGRATSPTRCAVSKDAAELVRSATSAATTRSSTTASSSTRYRTRAAAPDAGPTIFFCGRHEERKGLDVLLAAIRRARRRRAPVGRQQRARHGTAAAPSSPDDAAHRVARAADRRRQGGPAAAAPSVLRAVAARRVVRRRADRGDGRRDADRGQRPRRLPQRAPPTRWTRCSSSRATSTRSPRRLQRVLDRAAALPRALAQGRRAPGRGLLHGQRWPSATPSIYVRLTADRPRRGDAPTAGSPSGTAGDAV